MPADIKALIARRERLWNDRAPWENGWREIESLFCPRRSNILTGVNAGAKQTSQQYRAIGELAARDLASSLHGNLTNPSQRWLSFIMRQDELNAINSVQNYLDDTAQRFLKSLNASNFITEMGEWYMDIGTVATAAMLMFKRAEAPPGQFGGYLFETLMPGSYAIAEDASGVVDTIFYERRMSVRAAYAKWGEAIGKEWNELLVKNQDTQVVVTCAVYPREERNPRKLDKQNMAWASCVFDLKREHKISEGGFQQFPGVVGRWSKASGEMYGRGPGHQAIGEMQSANRTRELKLLAFALDLVPETYEKENAVIGGMIREPGARNIVRGNKDSVWTLGSGSRFDVTTIVEEDMKKTIERCFFVDQIRALPPTDKPSYMTAYEVAKRYEETFRLLGSAFGQLTVPLGHLVENGVQMLGEAQVLMVPPPELVDRPDADIDIEYQGPLALAQKSADVSAIELELGWAQQMQPIVPDIMDNYDTDWIAQHKAAVRGVPARGIRGAEARAALREQRAQQQAQMQAIQNAALVAKGMGDASGMVKALKPAPQEAA